MGHWNRLMKAVKAKTQAFVMPMLRSRRGAITVNSMIVICVAVLMAGILLPIGLSSWEAFTPTNATLLLIWPIGAVLIVLGIVLGFFQRARGN